MRVIFSLICVILIAGCAKHTRPKHVEKILKDGSWKITEFVNNGADITLGYIQDDFVFETGSVVHVTGGSEHVTGSWSLGENKNPAILYLSFPTIDGLEYISDDWQVTKITRNQMDLTRNDNSNSDRIHFVKN